MLPILIGAAIGAGLGYLGYREARRAHREAMGYLEGMRTPGLELLDEIKRYGLRQALERYGYGEVRRALDEAYRMQVSSILQRQARALALSNISPMRASVLASRMRTPLDIAYLQQIAGLPFEMLSALTGLTAQAGQQELAKATSLANLSLQRPSLAQDILAGITAGAQVGLGFAKTRQTIQTPYVFIQTQPTVK